MGKEILGSIANRSKRRKNSIQNVQRWLNPMDSVAMVGNQTSIRGTLNSNPEYPRDSSDEADAKQYLPLLFPWTTSVV